MSRKLIPRFTPAQAGERFKELEDWVTDGHDIGEQVTYEFLGAAPNATGGEAPNAADLRIWRDEIAGRMQSFPPGGRRDNDRHSMMLGKAIAEVIDPSPSDAAHDGAWSFLSLVLFPDLVHARWGSQDGQLPQDRWVGKQAGRDRNHLKTAWRRWDLLGPVMEGAEDPLGEDELVNLLERTSLARNRRLIRLAAQAVLKYTGSTRMDFTRELMIRVTYHSGPLLLDLLPDAALWDLVSSIAADVQGSPRAKRAAEEGTAEPASQAASDQQLSPTFEYSCLQ